MCQANLDIAIKRVLCSRRKGFSEVDNKISHEPFFKGGGVTSIGFFQLFIATKTEEFSSVLVITNRWSLFCKPT